jgi:hypothetical protein
MNEISNIYVLIDGEYVAVKISKILASEEVIEHYEWKLEKVYKEKNAIDFKSSGETFIAEDLDTVFFRINSYVDELNRMGSKRPKITSGSALI